MVAEVDNARLLGTTSRVTNAPDLSALLVLLHETGLQLTQQKSALLHSWGLHLLEDWRSLELLAEKYRESA